MRKFLVNILSALLVIALFYFLGKEFFSNWGEIRSFTFQFNVLNLLAASILYIAAFIFLSFGWHLILRCLHHQIPFSHVFLYFFITLPSKYIPGKIWMVVTRMKFCKAHNVPHSITLLSTGIEGVFEILAGSYISLVALLQMQIFGKFSVVGIAAINAIGLLLLSPRIFYFIINIYLKIVKLEPICKGGRLSFIKLLILQIIYIIGMLGIGLSQMFFLLALTPIKYQYLPFIASIGAFSYIVSIIAFFAPGGIGVRESIWYLALKSITTSSVALIYAFASRLWMIIIEVLLLFISLLALWIRKRRCDDSLSDQLGRPAFSPSIHKKNKSAGVKREISD